LQKIKATFLDALKGLVTPRKYINKFDSEDNIIMMSNKVENELYWQPKRKKKKHWWIEK
jgi:hypothetical protein